MGVGSAKKMNLWPPFLVGKLVLRNRPTHLPKENEMATLQCPNCQTHIQKPTNVLAWVFGILGALALLMVGGFLLIIVCLAAISAVGEAEMSDAEQQAYSQDWQPGQQVAIERQ